MARTAVAAPFTADAISPLLRSSAEAAATVGCADDGGATCGFEWGPNATAGQSDLGAQYSALEAIQGILVPGGKGLAMAGGGSSGAGSGSGGDGSPTPAKGAGVKQVGERHNVVALVILGLVVFNFL
jgi:mannan endo-1,6-alpha-mannosidase